jgi:hypothetical protein
MSGSLGKNFNAGNDDYPNILRRVLAIGLNAIKITKTP